MYIHLTLIKGMVYIFSGKNIGKKLKIIKIYKKSLNVQYTHVHKIVRLERTMDLM